MFSFSERGALRPVAKVHGKPTSELHGKVLDLHAKEPGIRIDPAKGQFDRIDLPDGARFEWLFPACLGEGHPALRVEMSALRRGHYC